MLTQESLNISQNSEGIAIKACYLADGDIKETLTNKNFLDGVSIFTDTL
jgi:hypothetical protein